jgi:hypothetical protein
MVAVRELDPDARFAVVAFRDPGYPAPEYEVLQPLTADVAAARAAVGRLRAVQTSDPSNVGSEAYNLVFQRSVTDASLGWRPQSRKILVVLGDGEPHGAGTIGVRGCTDTAPDPHGLKTTEVLQQMREAGRTLVMVRQRGQTATSLDCYAGLAALAAPGGAARDSGSNDLVTPVVSLIEGALTPLTVEAGPPFALTRSSLTVRLAVGNRSGSPAALQSLSLELPAGVSAVAAPGALGRPVVRGRVVRWTQPRELQSGASVAVAVRATTGSRARRLTFVGRAASRVSDGRVLQVSRSTHVRVARRLNVRVLPTAAPSPVRGTLSLSYPRAARTLLARTGASGTVTLGNGQRASRFTVRVTSARAVSAGREAAVVLTGRVTGSQRASCPRGAQVVLRLVDRDFRAPRTTPDPIVSQGRGCAERFAGEVAIG